MWLRDSTNQLRPYLITASENKKVSGIMILAIMFGCFVYTANNTITAAALSNWPDLFVNSEATPWLLLTAAERLLGGTGKVLVGVAVSCAVLSGIMGFYMASSRLMYSMAGEGCLPKVFGKIDPKYGTPRNAVLFCMIISLTGPVLGREALGWFLDMSAIGASIGFGFTCLAARKTMKRTGDNIPFLRWASLLGALFSAMFIFLQIVPVPGLEGVHFCRESYVLLVVWIALGGGFYFAKRRSID
jgi:amino acid transporter